MDLNPKYLEKTKSRFSNRFHHLELYAGNIQSNEVSFRPVEFIYAALVFEYVDLSLALERMHALLQRAGILGTVLQLPSRSFPVVGPSPFKSLNSLEQIMKLRNPDEFRTVAEKIGFTRVRSRRIDLTSGKRFHALVFCKPND